MANKGTHIIVGAGTGLCAYALMKYFQKEKWTLEGTFLSLTGGAIIGCLPDVIEPAYNPNHRNLFHSLAALSGIGYVGTRILKSSQMSADEKMSSAIVLSAYASHLLLDALTPKGLPLVG